MAEASHGVWVERVVPAVGDLTEDQIIELGLTYRAMNMRRQRASGEDEDD
jgi:hypothetical protein